MKHIENPLIPVGQLYNPVKDLIEDSAWGYHARGCARCAESKWDEAIADFEKAKMIDPEYAYVYWDLAITYQSRDKHRALQEFEQAAILFAKQDNQEMTDACEREASELRQALAPEQ